MSFSSKTTVILDNTSSDNSQVVQITTIIQGNPDEAPVTHITYVHVNDETREVTINSTGDITDGVVDVTSLDMTIGQLQPENIPLNTPVATPEVPAEAQPAAEPVAEEEKAADPQPTDIPVVQEPEAAPVAEQPAAEEAPATDTTPAEEVPMEPEPETVSPVTESPVVDTPEQTPADTTAIAEETAAPAADIPSEPTGFVAQDTQLVVEEPVGTSETANVPGDQVREEAPSADATPSANTDDVNVPLAQAPVVATTGTSDVVDTTPAADVLTPEDVTNEPTTTGSTPVEQVAEQPAEEVRVVDPGHDNSDVPDSANGDIPTNVVEETPAQPEPTPAPADELKKTIAGIIHEAEDKIEEAVKAATGVKIDLN